MKPHVLEERKELSRTAMKCRSTTDYHPPEMRFHWKKICGDFARYLISFLKRWLTRSTDWKSKSCHTASYKWFATGTRTHLASLIWDNSGSEQSSQPHDHKRKKRFVWPIKHITLSLHFPTRFRREFFRFFPTRFRGEISTRWFCVCLYKRSVTKQVTPPTNRRVFKFGL